MNSLPKHVELKPFGQKLAKPRRQPGLIAEIDDMQRSVRFQ